MKSVSYHLYPKQITNCVSSNNDGFSVFAVFNTYKEPVRGWTDNMYGPIGLLVAITMGMMHCILQDEDIALDMVPVDFTVNCLIACAWDSINHR